MFSDICATLHTFCAKKQSLLTSMGPQAVYQLKLSSSEQVLCLHHSSLATTTGVFQGAFCERCSKRCLHWLQQSSDTLVSSYQKGGML